MPMQLIKVGAAVLNQTPLAWESNAAHIVAASTGLPSGRSSGFACSLIARRR